MAITNYWWQIVWILLWGGLLDLIVNKRRENVLGVSVTRWTPFAAGLLALPYVLQAGFRGNGFGDTGAYRRGFLGTPRAFGEFLVSLDDVKKDKGFTVFSYIIKLIIGNSDVIFFIIIALIQMACLVIIYRKYSEDYWLSMFIFIASTDYMSWFHNGIRQFLGVALIMLALPLISRKKYILAVGIILVASTLHASALLMIPVIFIVQGRAWNIKTILLVLVTVVVITYIGNFTDILDSMLSDTQYSNMVTDWKEWEDDGTNPMRVLVYSLPAILSLIGYRQIKRRNDPFINMMVNFSIVTMAISVVSMFTSGIFIGRLIVYTSVFSSSILLPWEIKNLFEKKSARLLRVFAVFAYLGFYYYQMHFSWGLI